MNTKQQTAYTAASIKVLKGLDAVRKRPGMYIGNTDEVSGLHQMLYEVLDNAIDETLAGYCTKIIVTLYKDGSASVEDNGRGIPIDIHQEEGIPAAEVIMTQLHAGGKFSQDVYKVSGGLHGVGVSVVNALSVDLRLKIWKNKKEYFMSFSEGVTKSQLREIAPTNKTGTYVQFLPDPTIFAKTVFDYKTLCTRFQELAFLNPGVLIKFKDQRDDEVVEQVFHDEGGLKSFVKSLCGSKTVLNTEPLIIQGKSGDVEIDCALCWTSGFSENSHFFTNTIPQNDGGTHVAGLRAGMTKAFQNHIKEKGTKAQQKVEFVGDDIREGLVCVLSVKVPDPKFSSQTKEKLVSSNVRQAVESITSKVISDWLEENPGDSNKVIQKILDSANAREAARRARDLSRKGKSSNELNLQVAKKLAGCSEKDPTKCELFIVEGDSAGGSAKQARNRFIQAVLPLRGKILNIEKVNFAKALTSDMISTLISAIGTGIGEEFNINRLRYHKVIIMTDADVDGKHISALLLTFFFRYMKSLVEAGHIYLANPPLYGISYKKTMSYIKDDYEFANFILNRGIENTILTDRDGNSICSKEHLNTFLHRIYNIKNTLFDRMHYYAVSAKVFTDDLHDASQKILNYLSDLRPGKWHLSENTIFCHHNGVDTEYRVDLSNIRSEVKYDLISFTKTWQHLWSNNVYCDNKEVRDPFEFYDLVMQKGRKGIQVQRYKGLGEMNARELGSTTMQSYTQVTLDDAEKANQLCIDLMGENVAARRQFIEANAMFADVDL